MTITFREVKSTERDLPSGSPQGGFLGGIICLIKFNGALLHPAIPRNTLIQKTENLQKTPSIAVKFVDDGTVAALLHP